MIKRTLIFVPLILLFFTGCKTNKMPPEHVVNYYNALQAGDLLVVDYERVLYGDLIFKTIKLDGKEYYHPLEVAFLSHQYEVAEWLLEHGSNPNDIMQSNQDALLWLLIATNDIEGVQILLEYSVDTDILDKDGKRTPYHWAAGLSNPRMMGLLRRYYDVNIIAPDGKTPLFNACFMAKYDNVQFLVERGADINVRDNLGATPLIYAVDAEQIEIAEYLISKGADISIRDNEGYDALWYAEELGLEITGLNK